MPAAKSPAWLWPLPRSQRSNCPFEQGAKVASENTKEKARGETLKKFRLLRVFSFFVFVWGKVRPCLFPAYVLLLIPQIFVFSYYFPSLLTRHNPVGFLKAVLKCGFTAAWISIPFMAVFFLLGRVALRRKIRAAIILPAAIAAGYAWVVAWNWAIFPTFKYFRSLLPVLLCVFFSIGIPLLSRLCQSVLASFARPEHPVATTGKTAPPETVEPPKQQDASAAENEKKA